MSNIIINGISIVQNALSLSHCYLDILIIIKHCIKENSYVVSFNMVFFCPFRAISILPNRVIGSIGQHISEPIEEVACSWDTCFIASCAHDQLIKFWNISSLPSTRVSDYRRRKKKDGHLKALSAKAFGVGGDFFSGLLGANEVNGEEEEVDEGDSGTD